MKNILCALVLSLAFVTNGFAQHGLVETRIGKLKFENGYPSQESVEKLFDEMIFNALARLIFGAFQ